MAQYSWLWVSGYSTRSGHIWMCEMSSPRRKKFNCTNQLNGQVNLYLPRALKTNHAKDKELKKRLQMPRKNFCFAVIHKSLWFGCALQQAQAMRPVALLWFWMRYSSEKLQSTSASRRISHCRWETRRCCQWRRKFATPNSKWPSCESTLRSSKFQEARKC